jgi:hypothetical protein
VAVAALAATLVQERAVLLALSPVAVARHEYGANPFPEAVEIARWLRSHTRPDEAVAVIGSEPEIYFYAGRRAAVSYLYMYPMMEPQPFAADMQEDMIAQLERARPRYLVLVNVDTSWTLRPESSRRLLDWAAATVDADYRLVGAVDIDPDQPLGVVRWGADAAAPPQSRFHVMTFERRT